VKHVYFNSKQAVVVLPAGSPELDRSRLYEPEGNSDTNPSDAGSSDVGSELKHRVRGVHDGIATGVTKVLLRAAGLRCGKKVEQDRQCTYYVTMRRVRATIVAVETQ
jgi:hypothetical protein